MVFYRSEIFSLIFTLSRTMPSVLHILHWSIIGLQTVFLLICIRIVVIVPLILVDSTSSEVNPTMPSVLYILRWSIIILQCFCLLIHISIIAILALIPVDITGFQINPLKSSRGLSSPAGGGDGIALVTFVTFIFLIPAAPCHQEMQFFIHAIVVYQDIWVTVWDLWLAKLHFKGSGVK